MHAADNADDTSAGARSRASDKFAERFLAGEIAVRQFFINHGNERRAGPGRDW
jgi:hypothetical protein